MRRADRKSVIDDTDSRESPPRINLQDAPSATKKRKVPIRHIFFPAALLDRLVRDIPNFAQEFACTQIAVAGLLWAGTSSRREHSMYEGYFSFHHAELALAFGRDFKKINERLNFLEVKETWRFTSDAVAAGFTKGYRLTEPYLACLTIFLAEESQKTTRLLDGGGKFYRTLSPVVVSRDINGVSTQRWRVANDSKSLNSVKINQRGLKDLIEVLKQVISDGDHVGQLSQDLALLTTNLVEARDLYVRALKLLVMSETDVAGNGHVMQSYVEALSGRLYGLGGASLQNAPKPVRHAALQGCWDYDIKNCHFSLMNSMAAQHGARCVHIEEYMQNKDEIRAAIALGAGISIENAKKCMLAIMYGAKTTTWFENDIPKLIGVAAAARLFEQPLFTGIASDVQVAKQTILDGAKPHRQGGIRNAFGKSIPREGVKSNQLLAHILQGVEAVALRACVEVAPNAIVLLQHDGFTANQRLSIATLEQAIKKASGYELELEEEFLMPDLMLLKSRLNKSSFPK